MTDSRPAQSLSWSVTENPKIQAEMSILTVWTPLHETDVNEGLLCINSSNYWIHQWTDDDLLVSMNFPFHLHSLTVSISFFFLEQMPIDFGEEWMSNTLNRGDILLFGTRTVHGAAMNTKRPGRFRISMDTRFKLVPKEECDASD